MEVLDGIIDKIKEDKSEKELVKEILDILRFFIDKKNSKWDYKSILKLINKIGTKLQQQCPTSFPIFNILTRIKALIKKANPVKSEKVLGEKQPLRRLLTNQSLPEIKNNTSSIDLVRDLNELETVAQEACEFTKFHINDGETILIYAETLLLEEFIEKTFEEKSYALIIVLKQGQSKPQILEKLKGEDVLFVSENSVFSLMSRVNKVFMDCHAIMSDGASINDAGSFNIAIIAKEFAVPLFIIAPRYKFTPLYAFAQDTFNILLKPQAIFKEAEGVENLEIIVNKYNLIPSDYITIIITENGEYSSNYVYRVFSEYYSDIDYGYHFN